MKNFTNENSTIIGTIDANTLFKKSKDFIGKYDMGEMQVLGYIKTHSDMYDKDQYSIYVNYQNEKFMINVPSWYGKKLEEDFKKQNITPEEYFEDAYVKEIQEFDTKYNTKSVNIVIY